MRLHCLHGFLGSPRDWNGLSAALKETLPALNSSGSLFQADLFGGDSFPNAASLPAWAESYCQRERQTFSEEPRTEGRCLLGYSMGGRLALHLALQCPLLWDGVIIVGANPGLDSESARVQRRLQDEGWARRFESEPWEPLLAAWDAQPVFAGLPSMTDERREQDFSRARLADALRRWSVGAQLPLWTALRTLSCPLLWVAGEKDATQISICARVRETLPNAEVWVVPEAGHRVPWEQPSLFAARVADFLKTAQRRLEAQQPLEIGENK